MHPLQATFANDAALHLRAPGTVVTGAIRYTIGASALGKILVAVSEHGVCALLLGADEPALRAELAAAFPQAQLNQTTEALQALLAQAAALAAAPAAGFAQPLDLGGTAFQQRVWQALRRIPAGETASYAEIAVRIGQPDAVRAVAGACAANRLAIAIPCHRVIKLDGSLSGYRWGVERKRQLLQAEARA